MMFITTQLYLALFALASLYALAFRTGEKLRVVHNHVRSRIAAVSADTEVSNVLADTIRLPQVLEFIEPITNVKVKLVGAMHYNPVSIRRAEQVVEDSIKQGRLAAVLIESCPSRWRKTLEMKSTQGVKAQLLRLIMRSEMAAASDKAAFSAVPTVLVDQEIELTRDRMGDSFKRTVKDILSPFSEGWNRLYKDLAEVSDLALPSGPNYLGAQDFFDPRLLFSTPVTLLRYPLAFIIRAPITGAAVLGGVALLTLLDSSSGNAAALFSSDASLFDRLSDFGVSSVTSLAEAILLSRMFLVTILHERNIVLAENILDQCRVAAASSSGNSSGGEQYKSRLESNRFIMQQVNEGQLQQQQSTEDAEDVVIAVLGMAHCNGVMKLLQERKVN